MVEPRSQDYGDDAPVTQSAGVTKEPWTSRERSSPIPTHSDVNRPAPRQQGVFGWSIVIGVIVVAVLGVLFKWSLAGG